jgi:hypothetical protein
MRRHLQRPEDSIPGMAPACLQLQQIAADLRLPPRVRNGAAELQATVVAETEGFEPSVGVIPLRRFSKPLVSATHPRLRSATPTVPREDVFTAAENVFGQGAEGLAASSRTSSRTRASRSPISPARKRAAPSSSARAGARA